MRLHCELAVRGGSARLPLSDGCAEYLVAALLCDRPQARGRLLAKALVHDAPLAVWALCWANARDRDDLRTAGRLGEWLAGLPARQWLAGLAPPRSRAASEVAERDAWADRCARAIGVAERAAEWARHSQVDVERCYLLGLMHAAPEWLTAAGGTSAEPMRVLPDWLTGAGLRILSNSSRLPTSPAECVAAARRECESMAASEHGGGGLAFDPAAYQAFVAQARESWRRESSSGQQLHVLLTKLARLEQLEAEFQQTLEAEKIESLKELAYGASHEINNPLANISARAQTLLAEECDPERRRKLAAINSQAFRAHEMIADMMLFARPPQPKLERVELAPVVSAVVEELAARAAGQNTQLVLQAPAEPLVVLADKTQLAVCVRSLCVNALEALSTGGHLSITLECRPVSEELRASGEAVQITVADNGPGISLEARKHLFDPFYSGREAGRGLGLGLSKCWRIVTLHGGRIEVDSMPGEGARFTISLPRGPEGSGVRG